MAASSPEPGLPTRLETERLVIRLYEPGDAAALRELIERNREDLLQSFPKTAMIWQSEDACRQYIDGRAELWRGRQAFWAGLWLRDGQSGGAGGAGVHVGQLHVKQIAWEIPSAELGYFVDAGRRRQGLAAEAVRAAVEEFLGRRGFRRLFLRVIPSNAASVRLARSLGFRFEGRHADAFRCGRGELHDLLCYARTPRDAVAPRS